MLNEIVKTHEDGSVATSLPTPPSSATFVAPSYTAPLDIDAVIAQIPETAQIKGFFVNNYEKMLTMRRPELAQQIRDALPRRSYASLHNYPRGEVLRAEVALAKVLAPDVSTREALRRACNLVYPMFLSSLLGRVVLSTVGRNVDTVLALGPRMMSSVVNYGSVAAEKLGERHWRYHYRDYYSWLDSGDVGVIEGLLGHYGKEPDLTVYMNGPFEMWLDIKWRDRVAATSSSSATTTTTKSSPAAAKSAPSPAPEHAPR